MLAEPKRKVKWPVNVGRRPLWENDHSKGLKFGKELMEKMGWKAGQGLGVSKQGIKQPLCGTLKNDKEGMGFRKQEVKYEMGQQQQEFDEFLHKLSSSTNAGKNLIENRKNKIQSLEEKSRCFRARVHYKKFLFGKDLANYTEKDWQCILGYKKEPMKQDNLNHNEDEFVNDEDETGLTVNAGSMVDYFEHKMQNKAGVVGSDEVRKAELTKSVLGECESSQEPVKKKKESKKKELLMELQCKNHLEEKVNYLTCGGDNCKKNFFKEKSTKSSELDVNLISNSQSDQTDSTALIKKPRDEVVVEFDGGTSDFIGAEYKILRKGKRKHKTELEGQNIKHSETEKRGKKREKFSSKCGGETNSICDCSIPIQLLEQGNGEESTGNEGAVVGINQQCDVQKRKYKKKSRDERKNGGQFYEVSLQNDHHRSKTLIKESRNVKDSPAESEGCLVGNGREERSRNKKLGNLQVDSNIYKIELLKTKAKIRDSNNSKIENLIQFKNIEQFKGSNLESLKGYGFARNGKWIRNEYLKAGEN